MEGQVPHRHGFGRIGGSGRRSKSIGGAGRESGGTKEEIVETIRVAQYISGVGSVYTAARAFKELFVRDNI